MHEMLRCAMAGRTADRNILVGDDLTGIVPEKVTAATISLKGPSGIDERLPIREDASERRWTFSHAAKSGIYEARFGSSPQLYAVNVDPNEGNLARLDPEMLPRQLRHDFSGGKHDPVPLTPRASSSYFRWMLGAILMLLLAEPCLAWQFGRERA